MVGVYEYMGIGADGSASGVNRRVAEIRSEAVGEGDVRRASLTASRKTFTAGDAPAANSTYKIYIFRDNHVL